VTSAWPWREETVAQYGAPYAQYPALANLRAATTAAATAAATTAADASSPLNLFTSAATEVTPPEVAPW